MTATTTSTIIISGVMYGILFIHKVKVSIFNRYIKKTIGDTGSIKIVANE